jgi:outer membrane murein-binding lipoprotein Lpp
MRNGVWGGLGGIVLVAAVVSAGCTSSKEIEALKAQVQDLQGKLTVLQQSNQELSRVVTQAAQTANDARTAATLSMQKAEAAEQTAQAAQAAAAKASAKAAAKPKTRTTKTTHKKK